LVGWWWGGAERDGRRRGKKLIHLLASSIFDSVQALISILDSVVPLAYDFVYLRMDFANRCNGEPVGLAFEPFDHPSSESSTRLDSSTDSPPSFLILLL